MKKEWGKVGHLNLSHKKLFPTLILSDSQLHFVENLMFYQNDCLFSQKEIIAGEYNRI